ncbi:DEAD/DEAH box helicase [Streptomyces sp. NBC_00335]|uniref:DEAD/DEAH box helicase n=1 Tax=unclassified Streptomyces TaxID=2593676 RepID=UPI002255A756|nr:MULTISPECIES: DEAD/DEAH box helicase [unclassified Streptomyces]MCX5404787.1 DEAD/DEAH box helicase [Streptomyces sp. NBC_00086]
MTLPVAMSGTDVIGQAKTGTGKTLGFGLPLLERVVVPADVEAGRSTPDQLTDAPQALVVVPTRELCTQVTNDLLTAGKVRNVRVLAIYGGRAYEPQVEALKKGVDVIVGTPGRLLDLAGQKKLDLSKVKALVLDEADEMLDLGFLPDVERIMSYLPAKRQTMLFSATMPGAVIGLARRYMTQPTHIRAVSEDGEGATVANTTQHVFRAHNMDKPELVSRILQAEGRGLAMIFCRTKRTAADIAEQLEKRGFASGAVHGDLGQGAREQALRAFRNGKVDVLVCTDVAARGIDVEGVTHVINYQTPEDEKTFLHRVGRTGRAGKKGIAVTLVDWDDIPRWQLINKALELDFHDPVETYSTSPHLYEQMNIPAGTKGVLPRAERTRAGLKAENLEDLGETGGRGGRGGRDGGRDSGRDGGRDRGRDAGRDGGRDAGRDGGRDGGRSAAAPVTEERPARAPRQRRRTRGGSDQGAELLTPVTTEATPVAAAAPAVQAPAIQAPEAPAADEARKPRRRRTRSAAPAATFVAPSTTLEPLAPFVVEPEVDFQMAPLVEPVRERRTSAPRSSAPRSSAPRARAPRKAAAAPVAEVVAPVAEVVAQAAVVEAPAAPAVAPVAVAVAEEAPVKPKRTRTRKVAAAAPAAEVVAEAAAPVAEEAPVKPKRTRTRKVAAAAPEAPAAEAAAEEAPVKPKRTRTRKAVAAVETPEA